MKKLSYVVKSLNITVNFKIDRFPKKEKIVNNLKKAENMKVGEGILRKYRLRFV